MERAVPTGRTQLLRRRPRPTDGWLAEYIYPEDQTRVLATIAEAIRTRGRFEMEHRVRRRDGSVGWTHSRAVPLLDAQGSIREWIGNAVDITERRHKEQALNESQARYSGLLCQATAMKVAL
ncbi:PAS domain-containing protein [Actimicrobium sp. CCI2.3]|nr:PAS domain-containing protein [Actimicrobium sp. CCI2.3]